MPPRVTVDDKLAALEAAGESADVDVLTVALETALADRSYRVVALAAHLAAAKLVYTAVPWLLKAYAGFLDKPVKRDPNCIAKKAIARALYDLDCDDVEFFLAGLRYRQMEPVWGGSVDTAVDLRCSAAMGLVASGYPRALVEVSRLLTDSEPPVRAGAARAIACGNPREAELLLRLKIATGDEDPQVLGECCTGLLSVEPEESVEFVAGYLNDDEEGVREAVALALGESRLPAALECLKSAWDDVLVPRWFRQALIRAAALHRSEEAFSWLLAIVRESDASDAVEVIDALSIYRHNEKLMQSLDSAVSSRSDDDVQSVSARARAQAEARNQ